MSNGGYYKLTHGNPAESLKELCQLGQKRTDTRKEKESWRSTFMYVEESGRQAYYSVTNMNFF